MMDFFVSDLSFVIILLIFDFDGIMFEIYGYQQFVFFYGYYEIIGYYLLIIWDVEGCFVCVFLCFGSVYDSDQVFDFFECLIICIC